MGIKTTCGFLEELFFLDEKLKEISKIDISDDKTRRVFDTVVGCLYDDKRCIDSAEVLDYTEDCRSSLREIKRSAKYFWKCRLALVNNSQLDEIKDFVDIYFSLTKFLGDQGGEQ